MSDDHLIPNTTQVPNSILDLLMPFLHDGEARVLLYLCRRTYGFDRQSDSVSLDQFVNGIRNGVKQLDFGAGVSRRGAINALVILKEIGIVEQLEGGQGRSRIPVYTVNRKCEMVQWLHLIAQEPDKAREKIVQRLHLIREKHATVAPITRKLTPDAPPEEKVQNMHLKEKVQNATIKGANEFSENRASKGLDAHTKPSIQNPVKETPLEKANAFSCPPAEDGAEALIARDEYAAYPGFCELFAMAVIRPSGNKGKKAEALKRWKGLRPNPETTPTILDHVLQAYAYQKTMPQWQEKDGQYVPEIQVWIGSKSWEGVEVPDGFDRHHVDTSPSRPQLSPTAQYNLAAGEEAKRLRQQRRQST